MTRQQAQWASQHDWFVKHTYDGGVIVRCTEAVVPVLRVFHDFSELRNWAANHEAE